MLFDNTMKWVDSFVPMDSEVVEGKKAELKLCLEIVPKDDEAVNVESLATKYLIVDWKTHILAEDKMYYQIIRADGSTKYDKIFSAMLDDFDRQYVLDLYRMVKEIFKTTSLGWTLKDFLWGAIILILNQVRKEEILKDSQDYHIDEAKEKKYPLTQGMLPRMLSRRLEVDHECEMAFELLRFTRSQLKNAVNVTGASYEVTVAGYSFAIEELKKYLSHYTVE
ncbi:hypothetical protein Tco_1530143 [Tanacetum coccineum]